MNNGTMTGKIGQQCIETIRKLKKGSNLGLAESFFSFFVCFFLNIIMSVEFGIIYKMTVYFLLCDVLENAWNSSCHIYSH